MPHYEVHIEKNYACSQCGNKFGMKAARDRHIQDAHKENDLACSNYGKGFHRS
jgi:DNA-directed RNA polymerase subunit RPC12/RpoP